MAEHTKGPWHMVPAWGDGEGFDIEAEDTTVAGDELGRNGCIRTGANAYLIAAAPELLAALEALVDVAERHREPLGPDCYICPAVDIARAALRKAKGEA